MPIYPFRRPEQMVSLTWQQLLARASSESEVVTIARDFLTHLDYRELGQLPDACRPPMIRSASDVSSYAYELVRLDCKDGEPTLRTLASFFSEASIRLSQLASWPVKNRRESA